MTPRERDLLTAIQDLTVAGVPPSYDELVEHLGLAAKSGVNRMVVSLISQGKLRKRPHSKRSLEVVGVGGRTPREVTDDIVRDLIARKRAGLATGSDHVFSIVARAMRV